MYVINARNVNDALPAGIQYLQKHGHACNSRNGPVLVAPWPVATVYGAPLERVLFHPVRNANPFFHFMESMWMLAGNNDIAFVAQFNTRMTEYSDNGTTQHGAYGHRWRKWFGYDQLQAIVAELKKNPDSRRCVLAMWDGGRNYTHSDLGVAMAGGKDVPCNTHVYFNVDNGALRMTVCCRSNDIIWGAYGANAVHFSYLQEYIANMVGVAVGPYTQLSNNYHLYPDAPGVAAMLEDGCANTYREYNDKMEGGAAPYAHKLVEVPEQFAEDLGKFMYMPAAKWQYANPIFTDVAHPMYCAWAAYKAHDNMEAVLLSREIAAPDWRQACYEWLTRAVDKRIAKSKKGV